MKWMRLLNILVVTSLLFAGTLVMSQPAAAQTGQATFDRNTPYVPGEVVVTLFPKQAAANYRVAAESLAQQTGGRLGKIAENRALLQFSETADVESLTRQLAGMTGVLTTQPNYIHWIPEENPKRDLVGVDGITIRGEGGKQRKLDAETLKSLRNSDAIPTFANDWYEQWGNNYVNWPLVWPDTKASPSVCVIDTGVDYNHPDLKKKVGTSWNYQVINGWDFVNEDAIPNDDNGHGTHVAGTIAAVVNNQIGVAGISNGKVLAVKVLGAQGYGTSFDIAQGIRYCADQTSVRVLNMSLGGSSPDPLEYNALNYAVNTKGKLVVVAAGNDTTSETHYPAAWAASYICRNGSSTGDPDVPCDDTYNASLANKVHQRVISVGAGSAPELPSYIDANDDGYLWVDTNGDTLEITDTNDPAFWDEHFYPEECAADFSNYGPWVNIVAPGDGIYSTVPTSYPYYMNYWYGVDLDQTGYESFGGTSMATPHVAAIAARTWGTYPGFTATSMKTRLLNLSNQALVQFGMDPNMNDPALGYDDDGYAGEAPFCWPDDTHGTGYDMTGAKYVDIAATMKRGGLVGSLFDSDTGVPLAGATIKAFQAGVLKDQSKVWGKDSAIYMIVNLPAGKPTQVKVNKPNYTDGDVIIASVTPLTGLYIYPTRSTTAIPPKTGRISIVAGWEGLDWGWLWNTDLDIVTFLPGEIGVPPIWSYEGGELSAFPRLLYNREGGWTDPLGMESLTIMPRPSTPTAPFYNVGTRHYDFFLYEWETAGLNTSGVHARVWQNGKLVASVFKTDVCDSDGPDNVYGNNDPDDPAYDDDEVFWKIGSYTGGVFTPANQCSIDNTSGGGGILPYGFIHSANR